MGEADSTNASGYWQDDWRGLSQTLLAPERGHWGGGAGGEASLEKLKILSTRISCARYTICGLCQQSALGNEMTLGKGRVHRCTKAVLGRAGGSAVEPRLFVGISEGAGISSRRGPPPHHT